MHVVYTGSAYEDGAKIYSMEVYILDMSPTSLNKVAAQSQVVSNSEQCCEDIIADLNAGFNIFDFQCVLRTAAIVPLEESTKNVLCGSMLDIAIAVDWDNSACFAPLDGVGPGTDIVNYQRRGVLRVSTLDLTPDVLSVRTIFVPNGSLTDDGSGEVTLTIGAGSGTPGIQYFKYSDNHRRSHQHDRSRNGGSVYHGTGIPGNLSHGAYHVGEWGDRPGCYPICHGHRNVFGIITNHIGKVRKRGRYSERDHWDLERNGRHAARSF